MYKLDYKSTFANLYGTAENYVSYQNRTLAEIDKNINICNERIQTSLEEMQHYMSRRMKLIALHRKYNDSAYFKLARDYRDSYNFSKSVLFTFKRNLEFLQNARVLFLAR